MQLRFSTSALRFCAAVTFLGAAALPVQVPQSEIAADNARWEALGVHIPSTGIVSRFPYDSPYSGRSFIVPWSWYERYYETVHNQHDFPVRASDLRADLPTLRFLIERVYAGYSTAQQRGWDWDSMFSDWDRALGSRGDMRLSLHDAFAPWGKLELYQLDNHSGPVLLQDYLSGSASAVLGSAPMGHCSSLRSWDSHAFALSTTDAGQQPHRVLLWTGTSLRPAWYVSYPKRDGVGASILCGSAHIALRPTVDAVPESNRENPIYLSATPSYETLADGIAYIRMPTFIDANDNALRALLSNTPGIGKERVAIFDLRGNEGGNAPTSILQYWFSKDQITEASRAQARYSSDSCFTFALYFNLEEQLAAGLPFPAPAQQLKILQSFVDGLDAPSANDCSIKSKITHGRPVLQSHRLARPGVAAGTRIIALVDNECGSDCEFMTQVLADLPGTVLAGISTYGVMGFSQPGYFVLPHSRVPFRLALTRADAYGDGRSVDGYGISVDVLIPDARSLSKASLLALARAVQ